METMAEEELALPPSTVAERLVQALDVMNFGASLWLARELRRHPADTPDAREVRFDAWLRGLDADP